MPPPTTHLNPLSAFTHPPLCLKAAMQPTQSPPSYVTGTPPYHTTYHLRHSYSPSLSPSLSQVSFLRDPKPLLSSPTPFPNPATSWYPSFCLLLSTPSPPSNLSPASYSPPLAHHYPSPYLLLVRSSTLLSPPTPSFPSLSPFHNTSTLVLPNMHHTNTSQTARQPTPLQSVWLSRQHSAVPFWAVPPWPLHSIQNWHLPPLSPSCTKTQHVAPLPFPTPPATTPFWVLFIVPLPYYFQLEPLSQGVYWAGCCSQLLALDPSDRACGMLALGLGGPVLNTPLQGSV